MVATASATPAKGGRSVLIVEDNPDGRESLRLLLTILGHQVEVAADGPEGIRVALAVRPEVALIDLGLPRLDGFEVARQVRSALGQSVVLVACTAQAGEDTCRRVDEAGFDGHAVKPVGTADLAPWLDREGAAPAPASRCRRCKPG